ncbi:hypothetical protein M9H77_18004 [Catharanthus roseus]|uniref:Uncharacterized protein n=1 Tax=Catharanthus roseus TaxID=4058 RepID=A0ACC0B684_CATRO|nr:hypothetical protein M9H77_18004 [Catharanthus roseus]
MRGRVKKSKNRSIETLGSCKERIVRASPHAAHGKKQEKKKIGEKRATAKKEAAGEIGKGAAEETGKKATSSKQPQFELKKSKNGRNYCSRTKASKLQKQKLKQKQLLAAEIEEAVVQMGRRTVRSSSKTKQQLQPKNTKAAATSKGRRP